MDKDKRIKELEEVISQMKKSIGQKELLTFPWVGNLGQWYWMVKDNEVIFNDKKVINLGYDIDEIPDKIGFEFFTKKIHPDDYDRVMDVDISTVIRDFVEWDPKTLFDSERDAENILRRIKYKYDENYWGSSFEDQEFEIVEIIL